MLIFILYLVHHKTWNSSWLIFLKLFEIGKDFFGFRSKLKHEKVHDFLKDIKKKMRNS